MGFLEELFGEADEPEDTPKVKAAKAYLIEQDLDTKELGDLSGWLVGTALRETLKKALEDD
jgi:hypothetical protein